MIRNEKLNKDDNLLCMFNNRDTVAFEEVYKKYYAELTNFAFSLYKDTEIMASDVVHDCLLDIWTNKKINFKDIPSIKSYIYAIIRNDFKDYLRKKKVEYKYCNNLVYDNDLFIVKIVENEIYSLVNQAMELLPKDCAVIFELLLNNWNVKDIAKKINCSERTVYNKKYEAISILKNKLPDNKLFFILIGLS